MTTQLPQDWSIHEHPEAWPRSPGHVFMAEAVRQLGYVVDDFWEGEEPRWANQPPHPDFPSERQAFDEDGLPIAEEHIKHAATVRSIVSPAAFEAARLQRGLEACAKNEDNWSRLPALNKALEAALIRAESGADAEDPVTFDHWTDVWLYCSERSQKYELARTRLLSVAANLVDIAISGVAATFAAPIEGGIAQPVGREVWAISPAKALPRFAACGINLDDPMNPAAGLSHYLFLDRAELGRVVRGVAPPPGEKHIARPLQSMAEADRLKAEAVLWLLQQAEKPDNDWWNKAIYERELRSLPEFLTLDNPSWRKAWADARDVYPHLGAKGRRPEPK